MTGNVKRFVGKTGYESIQICEGLTIDKPYILVTYTINFGQVPETTARFLENNHNNMMAVATSGNKVWGNFYGKAGEIIANKYNVPLISKFELGGTNKDLERFKQEVIKLDTGNY